MNRILDAYVLSHHADPARAELRVVVRPEAITPTTEIKGRLMGPRSPYASTVEIAYPFRELARTDHILLRVLIPEPSFWEPKTPLLYEGPLELWQDGRKCEQIQLAHGIRTVQLSDRGLRVNGRPCLLHGVTASQFTEADARRWHSEGTNFMLAPARDDATNLLALGDRFGIFVLGRIEAPHLWPRWALASQRHASFLGSVLTAGSDIAKQRSAVPGLIGADVTNVDSIPTGGFDFIVMGADAEARDGVPTIRFVNYNETPPSGPNLLGWARRERGD